MKNIILLILVTLTLISCNDKSNEIKTAKWLRGAKKPIIVKLHSVNGFNLDKEYTLLSADGDLISTGSVSLTLPDTIK